MKKTGRFRRMALWLLAVTTAGAAVLLVMAYPALGTAAEGARRVRMEHSPQWRDGQFVNPEPIINDTWAMLRELSDASPNASPVAAIREVHVSKDALRVPPASGLRVTWLGHSTMLIEIDGHRVLTDPMWSERSSPLPWIGPKRWFAPPIALRDLPKIDAVVISHDHYDHLDYGTLSAMKTWNTKFVVPLGIGANLADWGIPEDHIVELDWWEKTNVAGLDIVCTPARHASGRHLFDRDEKLWGGFALIGPEHRAYYSGDTGLFNAMRDIGEKLGPFDVTMIEVGQYGSGWPDWHIGPEQAVFAHRLVRGQVLIPVHWALLRLAAHGWTEPVERVLAAAHMVNTSVLTPRPGAAVEPTVTRENVRWWPKLPWKTSAQSPIVSSQVQSLKAVMQ